MQEQTALKEADYTCNATNCAQIREKLSLPLDLSTVRLLFSDVKRTLDIVFVDGWEESVSVC